MGCRHCMATGEQCGQQRIAEGQGQGCIRREEGRGGGGVPNSLYQKWPKKIFPSVNFIFSRYGHFGVCLWGKGGGGAPPRVVSRSNTSLVIRGHACSFCVRAIGRGFRHTWCCTPCAMSTSRRSTRAAHRFCQRRKLIWMVTAACTRFWRWRRYTAARRPYLGHPSWCRLGTRERMKRWISAALSLRSRSRRAAAACCCCLRRRIQANRMRKQR